MTSSSSYAAGSTATSPAAINPAATSPSPTGPAATTPDHPGTPPQAARTSSPPRPVSKLRLTGNDAHSNSLSWINPTDPDFAGVLIRRAAGATPPIAAADGTLVAVLGSGQTTFLDKHLAAASAYSYAVFPRDKSHHVGVAATLITATRSTSTLTGLRGELTDSQGRGIGSARVEIRDASSGNPMAVAASAANGQFSVTGLVPGSYLLCFQPGSEGTAHSSTGYLSGCHHSQPDGNGSQPDRNGDTGTPVTVRAGHLTSGLLDEPPAAGALSGRVTDSAGSGLPGVLITASDPSTPEYGPYVALTAQDGTYTVAGLAAGSYQVCFHSQGASGASPTGYLDECYDDQPPHTTSGTPVVVNLEQTSPGVDATLAVAGAITGQVIDSGGLPVSDVDSRVWVYGTSQWAATGRSDSSGAYTAKGLPTGSYTVCFDGSYAISAAAPYGHTSYCTGDSVTVEVVAGQTTTFDGTVEEAGAVAGTVTGGNGPVGGVWVSVHDSSGSQLDSAPTDGNGSYQINGLAPGQVTVCFEPSYTAGGYQRTCYGAQPYGSGAGSPVTVTAGQLSTADVQLEQGASITGTVTDASGAPISDVLVSAFGASAPFGYASQTDASGSYTFTGVTADDYLICFDAAYSPGPATGGYAAECHDNQPSMQTADPVTVGTSGAVTVDAV
ncbi:MAG TPA: carboxypeptidase-like regulatory domain-containing protein, partial [Jatrophihabitans sp.]|nr:carboxypeptidase-like regulatory domain-containing protein [Jatrophihabitans sp.]